MKKILNWLFGSFFRTIGRVVAFLVIGLFLAYIINSNDLLNKLNLDWLILNVNASTYYGSFDSSTQKLNNTTGDYLYYNLDKNYILNQNEGSLKFKFNIEGSEQIISNKTYTDDIVGNEYCIKWNYVNSSSGGYYNCSQVSNYDNYTTSHTSNVLNSKFIFVVYYVDSNNNWLEGYVDWTNGYFVFNIKDYNVYNIKQIVVYYVSYNVGNNVYLNIRGTFNTYNTIEQSIDNNTGVINNNSQQQHQDSQNTQNAINNVNDTLTDDDTTESTNEASNFFGNFSTDTHGLTGVITAPLSAIQSLTSKSCSPLVIPIPFLNNKNLTLPCMRSVYMEFFGDFMDIYDVICLGVVSYWIMVRIFNLVKDFKNPDHDEIEVMDL